MTVRGADCDEVLSCQGLRDLGCVVNDGGVTQNASGKSEDVQAVQWRRWWAFAVPLTIIVGVAIVAVVWWLVWPSNLPTAPPEPLGSPSSSGATGDPGAKASDPGMLQIQAVRTILTAAAGIGALFGLVMIARRQQLQEVAHDLDREVARDNRHDATERRITELYMAAAEQLGHARAAVRLAALHALDRLGQNDVNHRQVIADIWCSYLRQPFALPARFTSISHTKNSLYRIRQEPIILAIPNQTLVWTQPTWSTRSAPQPNVSWPATLETPEKKLIGTTSRRQSHLRVFGACPALI